MNQFSDTHDLEAIAEVLRTLGHETRLRLMTVLLVHREQSVGDLRTLTGVRQPTLSQQLAILRKADLVQTRRDAKIVYYSIAPGAVRTTAVFLASLAGTPIAETGVRETDPPASHPRGSAAVFARIL